MKSTSILAIVLVIVCILLLQFAYAEEVSSRTPAPYANVTSSDAQKQGLQVLPDEATIMPDITDMPDDSAINANVTQPYIVKRGDTLWHIASVFLKNPRRWIKVWERNAYITNPDLIYPGNEIWFDAKSQQFMVGTKHPVQAEDVAIKASTVKSIGTSTGAATTIVGGTMFGQSEPEKVLPLIYKRPQIKIILPVERLELAVSSERLVTKLKQQDYVAQNNELSGIGYLLGMQVERLYFGVGDILYVHMQRIDVEKGTLLDVFHKGDEINDPDSIVFDYVGTLIEHLGRIRILRHEEGHVYRAEIINVFKEMTRGDQLKPARNANIIIQPLPAEEAVQGRILYIKHNLTESGQGNVVVVDLGGKEYLKAGTILNVTHKGSMIHDVVEDEMRQLPNEVVAVLMLLNVQHRASTALILQSKKPIHIGDIVISQPESVRYKGYK